MRDRPNAEQGGSIHPNAGTGREAPGPRVRRPGRLVFVRHGESVANERNVFAGTDDVPLNAFGRAQAREAGLRVAALGLRFDEVHVSRLSRAKETARIIAQTASDAIGPLTQWRTGVAALDERDFGAFTGRNKNLAARAIGFFRFESMMHAPDDAPPGGESTRSFYERVKRYHDRVLLPKRRAGLDVLVVAHKYVLEMMALVAAGAGPEQNFDMKVPNGRPVEFDELPGFVRAGRRGTQKVGDFVTAHCAELAAGAALGGATLQALMGAKLPGPAYLGLMLVLLAGAALLNALDVDLRVALRDYGVRRVGGFIVQWLPRIVGGLVLLRAGAPELALAGAVLLTPPAAAAPVLAKLWGGAGRRAGLEAAVLSVALPLVAVLAAAAGLAPAGIDVPTLAAALGGIAAATLAGQAIRAGAKTATAAFSLRWGWAGSLALVATAFVGAYQLAPAAGAVAWGETGAIAAGFVVLRALLGAASGFVNRGETESERRDALIAQQNPNVLVWVAAAGTSTAGFACLAAFLACIVGDGLRHAARERRVLDFHTLRARPRQASAVVAAG